MEKKTTKKEVLKCEPKCSCLQCPDLLFDIYLKTALEPCKEVISKPLKKAQWAV